MTEIAQPIELNLTEKLRDFEYRQQFFLAESSADIAKQLIALRKRRGLDQGELAKRVGTQQPAISRIEKADYQNWSFNTLRKIAVAEDARIRVIIEPAEDVLKEYETQSESVPVVSCDWGSGLDAFRGQQTSLNRTVIPVTAFYAVRNDDDKASAVHETTWQASVLISSRYSVPTTNRAIPKTFSPAFDEKEIKIANLESELAAARKELAEIKTKMENPPGSSPAWQIWNTMQSGVTRGIPT